MWPTMEYTVYLVLFVVFCSGIVVSTPYNEEVARQRGYYVSDRPLNQNAQTFENQNYARPQNIGTVGTTYQNPYNQQATQYKRNPGDEILRVPPVPTIPKAFETPPWTRAPERRFEYRNYYPTNQQNGFGRFPQDNLPRNEPNRQYVPQTRQNPVLERNQNFGLPIQRSENNQARNVEPYNRQQLPQSPPRAYYTDVRNREINRPWLPNTRVDATAQTQGLDNKPALIPNQSGIPIDSSIRRQEGINYTPTDKSSLSNYYSQDLSMANQRPEERNILSNSNLQRQLTPNRGKYMIVHRNGSVEYLDSLDTMRQKYKHIVRKNTKDNIGTERVNPYHDNGQRPLNLTPTLTRQPQGLLTTESNILRMNNQQNIYSNPVLNTQSTSQYVTQNNPRVGEELPLQNQNGNTFRNDFNILPNRQINSETRVAFRETLESNKNLNGFIPPPSQDSQISVSHLKTEDRNVNLLKENSNTLTIHQGNFESYPLRDTNIESKKNVNEFVVPLPQNNPPSIEDVPRRDLNVQPIESSLSQRNNPDSIKKDADTNRQIISESPTPAQGVMIVPQKNANEFVLLPTQDNQPMKDLASRGQDVNAPVNREIISEIQTPIPEVMESRQNYNEFVSFPNQNNKPAEYLTPKDQNVNLLKKDVYTPANEQVVFKHQIPLQESISGVKQSSNEYVFPSIQYIRPYSENTPSQVPNLNVLQNRVNMPSDRQIVPDTQTPLSDAILEPRVGDDLNGLIQNNRPSNEKFPTRGSNVNSFQTDTLINRPFVTETKTPLQDATLEKKNFNGFIPSSMQDSRTPFVDLPLQDQNMYLPNKDADRDIKETYFEKGTLVILGSNRKFEEFPTTSTTTENPVEIAVMPLNHVPENSNNRKIVSQENIFFDNLETAPKVEEVYTTTTTEIPGDNNLLVTKHQPYQQPLDQKLGVATNIANDQQSNSYPGEKLEDAAPLQTEPNKYAETTEPWYLDIDTITTGYVTVKDSLLNDKEYSAEITTKSNIQQITEVKYEESKDNTAVANDDEKIHSSDELISDDEFSDEDTDVNGNDTNAVPKDATKKRQNTTNETLLNPLNGLFKRIYKDLILTPLRQEQNETVVESNTPATANSTILDDNMKTEITETTTSHILVVESDKNDDSVNNLSLNKTKNIGNTSSDADPLIQKPNNSTDTTIDDHYKHVDVETLFKEYDSENPKYINEESEISSEDDPIPNPFTEKAIVKSSIVTPSWISEEVDEDWSGSNEDDNTNTTVIKHDESKLITKRVQPEDLKEMLEKSTLNDSSKSSDNKTVTFKIDADFWEKLKTGNISYDVVYLFQVQNQPVIEKETHTTVYPNGTIVQQYVEKTWLQDTEPVIQRRTRLTHPDGTVVEEPFIVIPAL